MLLPDTDERNKADFLNEMDHMKSLGYHAHIVSLLGCISNPNDPMLIVEYCSHGDMLQFLRRQKHRMPQVLAACKSKLSYNSIGN